MAEQDDYSIRVIGVRAAPLRDFYHGLLRLSWPATLLFIVATYLFANAIFAEIYLHVGGIERMRSSSFADAFFFSVQTMGTIGYGAMSPSSFGANVTVVAESVTSLLLTAITTGLVFAKFSRPTARILFAHRATIGKMEGVPTLQFRIGNQRSNRIVEATARVTLVRTDRTLEGKTFYRMIDLTLVRERNQSLSRSWNVLHTIDEKSPLFGETKESLATKEVELLISIVGLDDTWMQTVHAAHRYMHHQIAWNARPADALSEVGGDLLLDLRKFHDISPD